MLPHNHFISAGAVIYAVAIILFPGKPVAEIIEWILFGGVLSAAIDLDVFALVLLKSSQENRLKPFRNPIEIYRNFRSFMNVVFKTGLWKIGLITHLILCILLVLLSHLFLNAYFIPATLGVISHIISDIPNLRRLAR